jgi:plastocyanin
MMIINNGEKPIMEPIVPQPSSAPPDLSSQTVLNMPIAPTETQPLQKPKISKRLLILAIIVGVLAVLAIVAVLINNHSKTIINHALTGVNEAGYNQSEDQLNDFKQTANINVSATGASPQTLSVPLNTKIIWQNSDRISHEIAISPDEKIPFQFYNNRTIIASGGYPFVIRQTGTFHYYYVDNPSLTGEVIVK